MRLIKNAIEQKTCSGTAILMPEEPEDMWHAYNLIRPGDRLRAPAVRKVATVFGSGSRANERVHMELTIRVVKLDFDPQANQLHVSGQVAVENQYMKLGSFHTLDLEPMRNFTLEKADGWDSVALNILRDSINQDAKAQLWAVIMQDGLANICLVTDHQTILRQRIEKQLPRKRDGSSGHAQGLDKFFQTTLDAVMRLVDLADPKPLLLASPGFTATYFKQFINTQATATANKSLRLLLSKITIAHSASPHLHSLNEVLGSNAVSKEISDTKFVRETQLMDSFYALMRADDRRAWYGPRECEAAVALGAVGKGGGVLLISIALFRSLDIATRQRWVKVVDDVKANGGEVRILSSMHESGRRLTELSGVAVILSYPVEDLLGEDGDEDEASNDGEMNEEYGEEAIDGVEGRRNPHEDEEIDFF